MITMSMPTLAIHLELVIGIILPVATIGWMLTVGRARSRRSRRSRWAWIVCLAWVGGVNLWLLVVQVPPGAALYQPGRSSWASSVSVSRSPRSPSSPAICAPVVRRDSARTSSARGKQGVGGRGVVAGVRNRVFIWDRATTPIPATTNTPTPAAYP